MNDLEKFGKQFEARVMSSKWLPEDRKHHVLHIFWIEAQKYHLQEADHFYRRSGILFLLSSIAIIFCTIFIVASL